MTNKHREHGPPMLKHGPCVVKLVRNVARGLVLIHENWQHFRTYRRCLFVWDFHVMAQQFISLMKLADMEKSH